MSDEEAPFMQGATLYGIPFTITFYPDRSSEHRLKDAKRYIEACLKRGPAREPQGWIDRESRESTA